VSADRPVTPASRRGCWWIVFVLVTLTLCGGGTGAGLLSLAAEPNQIRTMLTPARVEVTAGESFELTLTIENVSLDTVRITGVGLDGSLRDAVRLERLEPAYRTVRIRNYPLLGEWTEYTFDRQVFAGDELTVTLTLTALRPGPVSGDVLVWVQDRLLGLSFERARRELLTVDIR